MLNSIDGKVMGHVSAIGDISGNVSPIFILSGNVTISGSNIATYHGDYEVVPKANEDVVLQTAGMQMSDDVTVFKVPYFETSNIYGDTVYIASEVI